MEEVYHFYPKYLKLFIGKDNVANTFEGSYKWITLKTGKGSYIFTKKELNHHLLDNYEANMLNNKF